MAQFDSVLSPDEMRDIIMDRPFRVMAFPNCGKKTFLELCSYAGVRLPKSKLAALGIVARRPRT